MGQHDYNIANAGGAAVRSDLNLAFEAIKTINSGSTAPTVTAPFMLWYDTAASTLKIRNQTDTAWLSFLNSSGQLVLSYALSSSVTPNQSIDANGSTTFTGGVQTTPVVVTFSATAMVVNCALSNVFTTTLTANVTVAPTYTNPKDGQTINWFLTQDATGTRTLTLGTSVKWPGATVGVLSTAANAVDLLVMTYRSATGFWYASLTKAFA